MRLPRSAQGLNKASARQANLSAAITPNGAVQTLTSGWYRSVIVQGVAIRVSSYGITSSSGEVTFYLANGAAFSAFPLNVGVPTGATEIVAVIAQNVATEAYPATFYDTTVASPRGYADGQLAACLAAMYVGNVGTGGYALSAGYYDGFEAGGALSISTSSIVLPVNKASTAYQVTVYFV